MIMQYIMLLYPYPKNLSMYLNYVTDPYILYLKVILDFFTIHWTIILVL